MSGGLDWPGLLRAGLGPARLGGLGLTPGQFWTLTPAELALMLGVDPAHGGGAMTRARLAELAARYPDRPVGQHEKKGGGGGDEQGRAWPARRGRTRGAGQGAGRECPADGSL
ncbi:phage tail assembly chaperone [Paracoccus kondratievae]|uniref:Phage tail assembly chaperone n=1 Tax=Paracoccus kondratievae TaxID=135740 RepID=A0AAD3NU42_9RHOB|nr:phage tail assembly chaperone [Paracoccus kondratievae]GLK63221.1 hypothetical protein GCM10017635_06910 [Paracoccus kondratievae]